MTAKAQCIAVEVSHVSNFGVWLLTHNKELFMPYEDFPWFKNHSLYSGGQSKCRRMYQLLMFT
jgi:hypothetical protein